MPFPTTGSVVSTDLDNMLRGLNRDNSDHVVTGTVAETIMASFNLAANTVGPTGGIFVLAAGTAIGAGGVKTVKFYIGGAVFLTLNIPSGTQCWFVKAWMYNTATNAQRVYIESGTIPIGPGSAAAPVLSYEYTTSNIDTTANQTVKVSTTNASAADTLTGTMWNVYVVQIN